MTRFTYDQIKTLYFSILYMEDKIVGITECNEIKVKSTHSHIYYITSSGHFLDSNFERV